MAEVVDKSAKKNVLLVACDDGYKETKVVAEDGTKLRLASLVRPGGIAGAPNDDVHCYETVGPDGEVEQYTATGEFDAAAVNTRFDSYPFSAENRVMIHHALRRAGLGGRQVKLATSLPVEDYFDGNSVAMRTVEAKSTNVMHAVRSSTGQACAEITSSHVYAEGVAAWVDFLVDDKGNYRTSLTRAAAVVDIGGRTTDTVKILRGLSVEKANSGTVTMGVLNLYDELQQQILRKAEILVAFPRLKASQVSRSTIRDVLASGRYTGHGLDVDMAAEVKAAKHTIAAKILRDVEGRIAGGFDLQHLLFVGGGAVVLKDEIKARYQMAEFVDEPEFANARGMLKAMKFA